MPNYDDLAAALADQSAAFGVFPQMGGRRKTQDVEAAKNIPVDILRGRVAGLLGAIPDLLNMAGRSPMPTETFGDTQYEPTKQLPYGSEHYLKTLPLAPTTQTGRVANEMGALVPLDPRTVVKAGKPVVSLLGNELARGMYGNEGSLANVIPTAMKPRFATEPQMQMAQTITKPKAEVSPLGFYSAVEQQALNIPRKQGTGESFLNDLAKGQDVKKYEMEAMGLDEFLRGKPNVTRQEVQDYIAGNRINVQEKQLGASVSEDPIGLAKRQAVFDKYRPQIYALEQEYKLYNDALDNQILEARNKFVDAHAKLNTQGRMPTAQDYAEYNLADEELKRIRLLPRNRRDFNDKQDALFNARDAEANAAYPVPEPTPSKYHKFQLPGGENYREILLTLPSSKTSMEEFLNIAGKKYGGNTPRNQWLPEDNAMYEKLLQEERTRINTEYRSGHFSEPNILAHMRVNDRVDAEGKKMLLIEEIQSDWHQAGREKGYKGKGTLKELPDNYFVQEVKTIDGDTMYVVRDTSNPSVIINKDYNRQSAINGVINELNASSAGGVPDAPFKDTWHQLALKRALKEAVDKGYDRIGLTTGAQQAKRYDLSKQVDYIDYKTSGYGDSTKYSLGIVDKNQQGIDLPKEYYSAKELPEIVGKEIAEKIIKGEGQSGGGRMTLRGVDLQVGGEGMKKYYDEIYPAFLNKQGKKYGAQVGETQVPTDRSTIDGMPSMYPNKETVRYLDITPEMRKAIKEGQPIASIQNELAKALA